MSVQAPKAPRFQAEREQRGETLLCPTCPNEDGTDGKWQHLSLRKVCKNSLQTSVSADDSRRILGLRYVRVPSHHLFVKADDGNEKVSWIVLPNAPN